MSDIVFEIAEAVSLHRAAEPYLRQWIQDEFDRYEEQHCRIDDSNYVGANDFKMFLQRSL